MKKAIFCLGVAVAMVSCNKPISQETFVSEEPQLVEGTILELDFSVNDASEPDTRAIQKAWGNGEEVYIFFDKEISNPPEYMIAKYDKNGSQTGKANSWYAKSWTSGLEAKISKKKSGVLSALYVHVNNVHGSLGISYSPSQVYTLDPKQNKGEIFYSYWLEASNVSYSVSSGKLSASITLAHPTGLEFVQFCMPNKDRNGATISNSDAQSSTIYKYSLQVKSKENTGYSGVYYCIDQCYVHFLRSDGSFNFNRTENKSGWLSAYIYGGLCFAGTPGNHYGQQSKHQYTFTLSVKDGSATKYYTYTTPTSVYLAARHAYTLPALNAKDSNGNYYWVEQ